jgi:hypothetical protein
MKIHTDKSTVDPMTTASAATDDQSKENTSPKKGFHVKALENRYTEKIMCGDIPMDFKLLSSNTEDRLSVFISTNNKRGFGPPLYFHYTFDEIFCVLQGSFYSC